MKLISKLLLAVVGSSALLACGDSDSGSEVEFDRGPILVNLTDNIILPAHQELVQATNDLEASANAFTAEPTQGNLEALRVQWLESRLTWKGLEAFTFGPIDNRFLDTKMDLFPISPVGLMDAIDAFDGSDTYLDMVGSDKKGFGAMEYMLFAKEDVGVLEDFASDKFQGYLELLAADLSRIAALVLDDWQNGYADDFRSNVGNDAGASITLYTNDMIELVEIIKNFKLATPLGVRTNSDPLPDLVESPYANVSKELIIQNLEMVETIFTGGTGEGLDDYLDALNISDDAGPLSGTILAKIRECQDLATELGTLQEDIVNDPSTVQVLLDATQELTTLTKSDMMSQLGLIVTFSSNDGD